MSKRQLHPLKTNPKTGEPYLQLPAPHENIIITLPRLSDAHRTIELHNDPGIYKTLTGPPFPYLMEHAETWQSFVKEESDNILHALGEAEAQGNEEPIFVNGCPIRALREVQDDGTDLYLGDIFIHRCIRFDDLRDAEQEKLRAKENMALPIGDPNIIWDVGDYIAPSHQRKGIMSLALSTLIKEWLVPRMNAKTIRASAFVGNIGSLKVFQKNGFELFDQIDDHIDIAESKGGGKVGLYFLVWRSPAL